MPPILIIGYTVGLNLEYSVTSHLSAHLVSAQTNKWALNEQAYVNWSHLVHIVLKVSAVRAHEMGSESTSRAIVIQSYSEQLFRNSKPELKSVAEEHIVQTFVCVFYWIN